MGFFKDFKEDASQAMKELMPQDDEVLDEEGTDEDDLVVNTLEDELDVESELSKLNGERNISKSDQSGRKSRVCDADNDTDAYTAGSTNEKTGAGRN